jgi:GNAT superfamily N-acetyltransferase
VGSDFPWLVERLGPSHDRTSFDCGVPALDDYLKKYARQNEEIDFSRTYVARRPDNTRVLGYFTISAGHVQSAELPPEEAKRFPRYPVPVVVLGRLAVDRSVQGQRLGQGLLVRALEKACQVSDVVGVTAVAVYATSDAAREFYLKNGFRELRDGRMHLILSMKVIRKLFGQAAPKGPRGPHADRS